MKVEGRKGSISGRVESGVGVLIETRGRSQQAHGFYEYMYVYIFTILFCLRSDENNDIYGCALV